jgi:hypothetical protein
MINYQVHSLFIKCKDDEIWRDGEESDHGLLQHDIPIFDTEMACQGSVFLAHRKCWDQFSTWRPAHGGPQTILEIPKIVSQLLSFRAFPIHPYVRCYIYTVNKVSLNKLKKILEKLNKTMKSLPCRGLKQIADKNILCT